MIPEPKNTFENKVLEMMRAIIQKHQPRQLILIKVDSWFGPKWLGFSGKLLGQLGVWTDPLSIPPFVPSRILAQRRFTSPDCTETHAGSPLHVSVPSSAAIRRKLAQIEPGAAVLWYNDDSLTNKRGVTMAYIPIGDTYLHWYASWQETHGEWQIKQTNNISQQELASLSIEA
jgi:hypothetical protein